MASGKFSWSTCHFSQTKKNSHADVAVCAGVFRRLVGLRANIRSINYDCLALIKNHSLFNKFGCVKAILYA